MKLPMTLFCSRLLLNLLIALQICASAIFGMVSIAQISKERYYYDMSGDYEGNYVYIPERDDALYVDSAIIKYSKSGEISLSPVGTIEATGYDPQCEDFQRAMAQAKYHPKAYSLGEIHSEIMKNNLKSGRWFSDEAEDGIIECVTVGSAYTYPLGEMIDAADYDLHVSWSGGAHGEGTMIAEYEILKRYRFRIVGCLGDKADLVGQNDGRTGGDADSVYDVDMLCETISYRPRSVFEKMSDRVPQDEEYEPTRFSIFCSRQAVYGEGYGEADE